MLDRVERIVREVAAEVVLPKFRTLAAHEILEKAAGETVTVADRASEAELSRRLTDLLPGALVVGEEETAADPGVLEHLSGDQPVWVIDPIDGTHNFARGNPRYATLVALAHRGELLGSWTFAPELDLMATARAGAGAVIEGRPVRLPPPRRAELPHRPYRP